MNRSEKAQEVENLKMQFSDSVVTILASYSGLSVSALTELRGKLREENSSLKVVKNRLAKIALKDTSAEGLASHFVGTTAVVTSEKDPAGPAKVLVEFAKTNEKLQIRHGFLDGKQLDFNAIKALASLPSKEELIARMLGSMQAPATNLVNVLVQIPRQLVNVLSAIKDQKQSNP